jgi:serine/threonine protein kinase
MLSNELGGYRLVEEIGRGSAGTVFVGEYGSLRRPFAIKVLHEHLVTDESADRMLAEARALSVLDHPGIVKVLDCGMTADGRAYIVMEYLAGEQLHQRLRHGPLTEQQVVLFARQLASALEVAHAAGIIHRDVKPENAFIVPDPDVPGGERIKLLDFGIAKCGGQERTQTGVVLGTPAYMAPEQFAASRRVDHRVDIYALGVVMYAMATGTLPFAGSDTDELLAEHAYCVQTPATATGVSPELSHLIDRCLAKQPDERFASMAQLGAALHELDLAGATRSAGSVEGGLDGYLDEIETAALVCNADVRRRIPWRSVIGVVAVMALALAYVRVDNDDSHETQSSPARVVEDDIVPPLDAPRFDPRPVLAPSSAVPATQREPREPTAIDVNPEQPQRGSTRMRQKPVRRDPVRADGSPARARKVEARRDAADAETRAATKKEDYAAVTPPTLY